MKTETWNILQIEDDTEHLFTCTADGTTEVSMRPARRLAQTPRPLRAGEARDLLPQGAQHHPVGVSPRATAVVNDLATVDGPTEMYFQRLGQAVREATDPSVPLFVAIDSGRVAFFGMNCGLDIAAYIDSRGSDPHTLWRQTRDMVGEFSVTS